MTFRITGLPSAQFAHLFGLEDGALAAHGAQRIVVDSKPGAPCRITLADAEVGEPVLLLNHEHQPHDTPFRSRHAIFVREGERPSYDAVDVVPEALRLRTLSIRAFDGAHQMVDADLVEGAAAGPLIEKLLARPDTAYLQAHYARRGCYAARIERA